MAESFSHISLLGALRQPVHVETLPSGTPCGTFDLIVREQSSTGQWFSTVVPCQAARLAVQEQTTLAAGLPPIR